MCKRFGKKLFFISVKNIVTEPVRAILHLQLQKEVFQLKKLTDQVGTPD